MKRPIFTIVLSSAILASPAFAETTTISNTTADTNQVATDSAKVIAEVTQQVKANPENAASIVKAAIRKNKADPNLVAQIVVAAVTTAPDQTKSVSIATMAVAPDAFNQVVIALAKLDGYKLDEVAPEGTPASTPNPNSAPGDDELIEIYLAQLAADGISTTGTSSNGSGKGQSFTIKFLNAITVSRGNGAGSNTNFPVLFNTPRGLQVMNFIYDTDGDITGIIVNIGTNTGGSSSMTPSAP